MKVSEYRTRYVFGSQGTYSVILKYHCKTLDDYISLLRDAENYGIYKASYQRIVKDDTNVSLEIPVSSPEDLP